MTRTDDGEPPRRTTLAEEEPPDHPNRSMRPYPPDAPQRDGEADADPHVEPTAGSGRGGPGDAAYMPDLQQRHDTVADPRPDQPTHDGARAGEPLNHRPRLPVTIV